MWKKVGNASKLKSLNDSEVWDGGIDERFDVGCGVTRYVRTLQTMLRGVMGCD